ncbi:tetratricopeptide repeat protein [Nibricoccus aquaticus]|nr:tetratricopeptide repeat protein [Nibricoccus aquaticus]
MARKTAATPAPATTWPRPWLFAALLLASLIAYWPALNGELLWDDPGHLTRPDLQSWSGLWRIWFEVGATQQHYPLLHSAFWIQHHLWGDATTGYHLINILWHATAASLFAALLRRLQIPGSIFAAFVFALHPVCVESVAWITEQKNTLSTVFYLAAALAWLRYEDDRRPSRYIVATAWFAAALLSKTVTATLPAALLVLAWYRRGRLSWRTDILPLLPWLALGIAAGLGTLWVEKTHIGATGDAFALTALERPLLAGRVVWFYLAKLLWPADLAFFYPRWSIDAHSAAQWLFPLAALAALAASVYWSRRDRAPLAAALLFGGTLVPVLGFVNVYPFVFSYVADHFQYLACLPIIALLAAAATRTVALLAWPRWSGPALATALLLLLGTLTWHQSHQYRDVFALYETTLARNPDSWVAHLNLGVALDDTGQPAEALPHLQRALELKPDFPETLNSLGSALNRLNRPAEAKPLLEKALLLQPRFASAHNNLGIALIGLQQTDTALASFQRALEIDPAFASARVNYAWALANSGRIPDALVQLAQARRDQPAFADAHFKTGLILAMSGQIAEATPHLRRAVELQPDNPDMHFALAHALLQQNRLPEATAHFEETLSLAPNHPGALDALHQLHRLQPR